MLNFLYEQYDTYDELTEKLKKLQTQYPELAKLNSIATTPEGRQLWMMVITDFAAGEADLKPAYYIDGNFHAGEVTGSMVALYTIDGRTQRSCSHRGRQEKNRPFGRESRSNRSLQPGRLSQRTGCRQPQTGELAAAGNGRRGCCH